MVTNEIYDRKVLTLWGDLAEIDGALLDALKLTKPVLVLCDVKCSIYQGDFVLSTTPISSLLINPPFVNAANLQLWHDDMKAQNVDISLMPSKLMRTARKVKVADILNGSLANMKRVNVIKSSATCSYCRSEDIDYEERLKIDVTAEEQFLSITLFDGAEYFFGCGVQEYVQSTSKKKEDSVYYRKMILSKGKEFIILGKIAHNFPKADSNMNLIAVEIHEVENELVLDENEALTPV